MSNVSRNVIPTTIVKDVREELARFTGISKWTEEEYWKYFLKGRNDIFKSIFNKSGLKPARDWTHPDTIKSIDQQFKDKVKLIWEKDIRNQWILQGNWLEDRPDIVSWMRAYYWKHHKQKYTQAMDKTGFLEPWNVAESEEATPTNEASSSATLLEPASEIPLGSASTQSYPQSPRLQQSQEKGLVSLAASSLLLLGPAILPDPKPAAESSIPQGDNGSPDGKAWMDVMLQ